MAWQTNKVSDVALIEQWRTQRDAGAFAEIVSRHAGMVFAACNRILGDRAAAEEVSQECLFALACANGEVPTSPGGWLHTVATRLALKRVHSDAKRRVREEVYVEHQQIPTRPEWVDIKHHVDEAVEELPEALRFVVVARRSLQPRHPASELQR
jgi:DNA-directed RNA polymerase specialized sigma24 family protein